jgi:hypothetical protein
MSTLIGKPYLLLSEVAILARCSEVTVRRAVQNKRLSVCKPNGKFGRSVFRREDVLYWLDGSRILAIGDSR